MGKGVLYIAFVREDSEAVGFVKKIKSQCKAFSNLNFQSYLFITTATQANLYQISNEEVIHVKSIEYSDRSKYRKNQKNIKNKVSSYHRFNEFLAIIKQELNELPVKNIYFRRMKPITPGLIKFIKFCKQNDIRVFYEFPDYPWYAPDSKEVFKYIDYIYDRVAFIKLKQYIYKIVGVSVKHDIDKKDTIIIKNGIDLKTTPLKVDNTNEQVLNLVGVASVGYWHAYDRLINGLKEFYKKKNKHEKDVIFHVVGDGAEIPKLKRLVEDSGLADYVIFHGLKTGKELDTIMNYCDIGVGILGNHRKNLYGDSSLKNREYCARGLPFIIAANDYDFESFKYKLQISANEEDVNIADVLKFYQNIKREEPDFSKPMRDFAEKNLTWESKLKPITHHFK